MSMSPKELAETIKAKANQIGFDLVGIAPAVSPEGFGALKQWLDHGYAGQMEYIDRRREAYAHPKFVMENVKTVIALAVNYKTEEPPNIDAGQGRVARYAWGEVDYHDLLRGMLKELGNAIHELKPNCKTRGTVDTAPILERDFAKLAGLGWFGKNTMLINKFKGSFLFLSALLLDFDLPADAPHETSHCGTCTRCLDVCPTDAFVEPYVLDARKCISYLTIELRDEPIPLELREGMQDWMFGCDLCQDVCPWNRKSESTSLEQFQPKEDLHPTDALKILDISEDEFRSRFRKSPIGRPKWTGILRNAAVVIGNTKSLKMLPHLEKHANHSEPLVRETVAWAVQNIRKHNPEL